MPVNDFVPQSGWGGATGVPSVLPMPHLPLGLALRTPYWVIVPAIGTLLLLVPATSIINRRVPPSWREKIRVSGPFWWK